MSFKCIHIADVHFRGLKRHCEYKEVFEQFFKKARNLNPDIIFIGGDIVHSKTQGISPELIDLLCWWFESMSKIADVHVILGNHDGLILNEDRQDAITPIIKALDIDNIYLYKDSGVYPTGIKGFNWCIYSCFDEKNWNNVEPIEDEINIACFHGGVLGSTTDIDWNIDGEVELSFFNGYDFVFLGDIHKYQYLDSEKRVAYPGSTIQQNFGEDVKKGFLYWEIKSKYDYNSKFIELENSMPFVTIDWLGSVEKTIDLVKPIKEKSRIRIRSNESISQIEIQTLHSLIKEIKNPSEIVYRIDNSKEHSSIDYDSKIKNLFDLKSSESRYEFLKDFLKDTENINLEKINNLFDININKLENTEISSNSNKWSINSLKFSNTYGYGKSNEVNFDNMRGIIGIFGKNRCGKSSIPGTLMYGLFNSSDRGSIKNLHIINSRKGECNAEIGITVNDEKYIVKRSTKKNQTKKGVISANTSLSLHKLDKDNILNKTEEQRRETEKILRNLIGKSEDFLYTSFASQGEINTFIKEKNTSRKTILSKFLNLDIYEELWKVSREEYTYLKSHMKTQDAKDWNHLINETSETIISLKNQNEETTSDMTILKKDLIDKEVILEDLKRNSKKHRSGLTFSQAKDLHKSFLEKLVSVNKEIQDNNFDIKNKESKLIKIESFKESFPIEDLNNDKEKIDILRKKLSKLEYSIKTRNTKKLNSNKKLKILEEVPCGDSFPTCKFIKDAHEEKNISKQLQEELRQLKGSLYEVKNVLNNLVKENIEEKVKKYNDVLNTEYKLNLDLDNLNSKVKDLNKSIDEFSKEEKHYKEILIEIQSLAEGDNLDQINKSKKEIEKINNELYFKENKKQSNTREIIELESKIKSWENEKEKYNNLVQNWKLYDLFTYCVSKKGIPTKLIDFALPRINNEIHNILRDVAGFTVEISADSNSNSLDVFINYGDSKRIIECGSGMEKMMASLAIRIALINISSLPRSDIFIIDEGFGALDETNIEACGRFLRSLKKWFKTILIISHVDSIKDIVDNTLEINSKGKDAHVIFR